MNKLQYPLQFKFRIGTLANDFIATDASGATVFYVREKIFAWKDQIKIYADEQKTNLLYELKSNRLIDFQQTFTITDSEGRVVGKVRRKTIRSLWRSTFNLMDAYDTHDYTIHEKNPWIKLGDSIFGEIPVLGALSGYILNPSYILTDDRNQERFELKKEPSFFGRKFSLHKIGDDEKDEERLVLSVILMVLMERNNG